MTPEQTQQLAALRERLAAGDSRLVQVPEIHTLLNLLDEAESDRTRIAAFIEYDWSPGSIYDLATGVKDFVAEMEKRAADTRQAEIVAWLREQADNGEKYLDDNGLDRNMHPSTVSAISTMRTVAGSIELGLYKGGRDG